MRRLLLGAAALVFLLGCELPMVADLNKAIAENTLDEQSPNYGGDIGKTFTFVPVQPGKIAVNALDQTSGAVTAVPGSPFNAWATVGTMSQLALSPANGRLLAGYNDTVDEINVLHVDSSTGALSLAAGFPASTGFNLVDSPVFSPDGKYLYVLDTVNVYTYPIDVSTGQVGARVAKSHGAVTPHRFLLSPNGKFAFIGEGANATGNLKSYTIASADGSLGNSVSSHMMVAGFNERLLAINPQGTLISMLEKSTASDLSAAIHPTTGALTLKPNPAAPSQPSALTFDSSGNVLYIAEDAGAFRQIWVSKYDGNAFASVGSPMSFAINAPTFITFSKNGQILLLNDAAGGLQGISIDTSSGALTVAGSMFASRTNFAVDPVGGWGLAVSGSSTLKSYQILGISTITEQGSVAINIPQGSFPILVGQVK